MRQQQGAPHGLPQAEAVRGGQRVFQLVLVHPAQQAGDIADPEQPPPSVFFAMQSQIEQQEIRRQRLCPESRDFVWGQAFPQFGRSVAEWAAPPHGLPVQFDQKSMRLVVESIIAMRFFVWLA